MTLTAEIVPTHVRLSGRDPERAQGDPLALDGRHVSFLASVLDEDGIPLEVCVTVGLHAEGYENTPDLFGSLEAVTAVQDAWLDESLLYPCGCDVLPHLTDRTREELIDAALREVLERVA